MYIRHLEIMGYTVVEVSTGGAGWGGGEKAMYILSP